MKTKNLIVILGAVAFAAITTNINASNVALTPRAAGNQTTKIATVNSDPILVTAPGPGISPRAFGNQITRVAGVNNDVNPATACARTMRGTPKAVSECTSHTTMPSCNSTAVASAN